MPPSGDVRYVYSPDTLQVMGAAFDTALLSLPPNLQDHEGARRKLALIILRHADRGEPDAISDEQLKEKLREMAERAKAELAKRDLDRGLALVQTSAVSEQVVDQRRQALQAAHAAERIRAGPRLSRGAAAPTAPGRGPRARLG